MSIEIRSVETAKQLDDFIKFPWNIYRKKGQENRNWVPPLLVGEKELFDKKKNPFWEHAEIQNFLAYRDGEIAGRISAVIDNNYIQFQDDNAGFFGFLESVNDQEVSHALFSAAETWLKEKGVERAVGPMNPSTNHILGLLTDSFDIPPTVQMGYNPDYYTQLCEAEGYSKERDLLCYRLMRDKVKPSDKITRVAEISMKRSNLTIRSINMKKMDEEVPMIRELYNEAWEKNWGFVPWTSAEFDAMAEELKLIADPELVLMIFSGEKLVGISIPLPNINEILIKMNGRLFPFGIFRLLAGRKRCSMLRVAILGVHGDYRNKGIDAVFTYETYKRGSAKGYQGAEFSWILEDNTALRNMLETWGTEMYRTYRVYQKKLQ